MGSRGTPLHPLAGAFLEAGAQLMGSGGSARRNLALAGWGARSSDAGWYITRSRAGWLEMHTCV